MTDARWRVGAFTVASILAAALFAWLFAQMQLTPREFCAGFGLEPSVGLVLMVRRASMLMLGFAVLLFLARRAPPSPLRRAVSLSVAVTMAGFAAMGTQELLRGALPPAVWAVVGIEVAFAATFLGLWLIELRGARGASAAAGEDRAASHRSA